MYVFRLFGLSKELKRKNTFQLKLSFFLLMLFYQETGNRTSYVDFISSKTCLNMSNKNN